MRSPRPIWPASAFPGGATARQAPEATTDTTRNAKGREKAPERVTPTEKRHVTEGRDALQAGYVAPTRPVTCYATNCPYEGGGRRAMINHLPKEHEPALLAFLKSLPNAQAL